MSDEHSFATGKRADARARTACESQENSEQLRARLAAAEEDRATLIQRMKSVYGALVDTQDIRFSADTLGEAVRELAAKRGAAEKENERLATQFEQQKCPGCGRHRPYCDCTEQADLKNERLRAAINNFLDAWECLTDDNPLVAFRVGKPVLDAVYAAAGREPPAIRAVRNPMTVRIFVFGSNTQGRHGAGAAAFAVRHHGAVYRQPSGLQGNSYAIITKELRKDHPPVTLEQVAAGVAEFLAFAREHAEWQFELTPIGCGLAGFAPAQIAPLFAGAPANVELPKVFLAVLESEAGK